MEKIKGIMFADISENAVWDEKNQQILCNFNCPGPYPHKEQCLTVFENVPLFSAVKCKKCGVFLTVGQIMNPKIWDLWYVAKGFAGYDEKIYPDHGNKTVF